MENTPWKELPPTASAEELLTSISEEVQESASEIVSNADKSSVYAQDALRRFAQFIQATDQLDMAVTPLTTSSPLSDIEQADAHMLNVNACYLMLGLKSVRSISDISAMNNNILKFIRERRAVLGHPLNDIRNTGKVYLEPV